MADTAKKKYFIKYSVLGLRFYVVGNKVPDLIAVKQFFTD